MQIPGYWVLVRNLATNRIRIQVCPILHARRMISPILKKPSSDLVVCENKWMSRRSPVCQSPPRPITMALSSVCPNSPFTSAWPFSINNNLGFVIFSADKLLIFSADRERPQEASLAQYILFCNFVRAGGSPPSITRARSSIVSIVRGRW